MTRCILLSIIGLLFYVSSYSETPRAETKITWDTWGVPHIEASSIEELFFAQGWAQMHNHANLILELYGSSRGKGAEYWGKEKLSNDILIHTLGLDDLAEEWVTYQKQETKIIYSSFVKGMNAYAEQYPESIDSKNKCVLPLSTKDVHMHVMYVVFTRFVGGGELGRIQQWPDMGSNSYAISPKRSESGNAMLVQNPHLPWWKEFLFFESHLKLNGKNMYGATLVGFPGIAIGFNENLGWSHTDNTIDNADTYDLVLQDGGYLLDGERREFHKSSKNIRIKQEDGSMLDHEVIVRKTIHGPVVKESEGKVLALRMTGLNKPNMLLQWWHMVNSSNLNEFEIALQMAEIPFWNVMYADKQGEIFYLFNGLVPKRRTGDWDYWNSIITGGKSNDIWEQVHPYYDLPKIKNPVSGWLQNSNDPPWTCTYPIELSPDSFPAYMAPVYMSFRSQRSSRMIREDQSISFDDLIRYKHSTRLEFADRILDDLFEAIDLYGSEKTRQAKKVLEQWDRNSDADSKGTLLFYTWARKFHTSRSSNYTEKWSIENPCESPDGIADPVRAVSLLENAADEVEAKYGSLGIPWGEYFRIDYNGKNLPANGMHGAMGVYRVTWPGRSDKENAYVGGGDSWVGVLEFGERVKAKVLLSYGNSSQKNSPHNGDQLELFSKKQLRDAWITQEEIDENMKYVEVRTENGFAKINYE